MEDQGVKQDEGVKIETEHLMGGLEDALNDERRMNVLLRGLVRQQQSQLVEQSKIIEAQAVEVAKEKSSAPATD